MPEFTLIVPYYRNMEMLKRHAYEWISYDPKIKTIVVDDGSPEPAKEVIHGATLPNTSLCRITVDIPWNREGARNLGAKEAKTEWIVQADIDHILLSIAASELLNFVADASHWYRFPRWRVGAADDTRKKDLIPKELKFGQIRPHIDSYLITRDMYWMTGGYDEDFAGCLGGGSEFLKRLSRMFGPPRMLPETCPLYVHTRDVIKDASDWSLSRDTVKGKLIAQRKGALSVPKNSIRFEWEKQL